MSYFLSASLHYLINYFSRRSYFLSALLNYWMNLFLWGSYFLLAFGVTQPWNTLKNKWFGARMGSSWLAMGPYWRTTKPPAPGRFLDTSRASGIAYNIQKCLPKVQNQKQKMYVFQKCNIVFSKTLGMNLPGVESVGAPRESVFSLVPASQRPYTAKSKKSRNKYPKNNYILNFVIFL